MRIYTSEQYRDQLLALQQPGIALPEDLNSKWAKLVHAFSGRLTRVEARAKKLLEESDPATTFEMLSDWERALGLPDVCSEESQSIDARRAAVLAKWSRVGSLSKPFYIAIASVLGFEITIEKFQPFTMDSTVADSLYGMDWQFCWKVKAPEETVRYFTVADDVSMPLSVWGNQLLECVFKRIKPSHTVIQFSYGE